MHAYQGIRIETRIARQGRATVLHRLDRIAPLDAPARTLIENLEPTQPQRSRGDVAGERAGRPAPRFITSGWAAKVRSLPDGRRQILAFLLPGDSLGVAPLPRPLVQGATVALTNLTFVDAQPVQAALVSGEPQWKALRDAMHVSASLQEAYLLNQVVRLGRLTAYERMCHLVLEIGDRLQLAGIGDPVRFPMPLTQEMLADALGLSVVHVNRVLQQLRREGLIDLRSGIITLRDPQTLRAACDYASPRPEAWRP